MADFSCSNLGEHDSLEIVPSNFYWQSNKWSPIKGHKVLVPFAEDGNKLAVASSNRKNNQWSEVIMQ